MPQTVCVYLIVFISVISILHIHVTLFYCFARMFSDGKGNQHHLFTGYSIMYIISLFYLT